MKIIDRCEFMFVFMISERENENHRSEICVWFVILKEKIINLIRPTSIPFKMSLKLYSINFITY